MGRRRGGEKRERGGGSSGEGGMEGEEGSREDFFVNWAKTRPRRRLHSLSGMTGGWTTGKESLE